MTPTFKYTYKYTYVSSTNYLILSVSLSSKLCTALCCFMVVSCRCRVEADKHVVALQLSSAFDQFLSVCMNVSIRFL